MGDPLSVTASIIAVLQLAGTVVGYLNDAKDAGGDRKRILDEITATSFFLYALKDKAEYSTANPVFETIKSLNVSNGPMEQFKLTNDKIEAG
jgi:hypothetical protein